MHIFTSLSSNLLLIFVFHIFWLKLQPQIGPLGDEFVNWENKWN